MVRIGDVLLFLLIVAVIVFFVKRKTKAVPVLPEPVDEEVRRQRALELLREEGYSILTKGAPLACALLLDDERVALEIVPDFTVRKDGEEFVVKVAPYERSGLLPEPEYVRRELLPFLAVYPHHRLLYLDVEEEWIDVVEWDIPG
jgi:hypothetical protein